jgi:glycosyltransferase involved in cell wall biosynthesis
MFGAERGGCERNAWTVISHLDISHRVLVLDRSGPMVREFCEAGAQVDVWTAAEINATSEFITRIRKYVAVYQPQAIVFWHGIGRLPAMLYALRDFRGAIAVHGGNPAHTMPFWVDWKFCLLAFRYPVYQLPTYVCASNYIADSFAHSRYLRRFPHVVVPNPVAAPQEPPHQPRELLPNRPMIVGMLARLDPIKDHSTLLRAVARMRSAFPQVRLELAGSGPKEMALRTLASELGIADAVVFLGQVSDVYGVLARWDLFAFATTEREGLGNAVVEAMMLGLPCVVTDVGPMQEACGGSGALLVPPGDPTALADGLLSLAHNLAARIELGQRARNWAMNRYRPEIAVQQYAEVLRLPSSIKEVDVAIEAYKPRLPAQSRETAMPRKNAP